MNLFAPTDANPGSDEKIELLARRLVAAERMKFPPSIFVKGDRTEHTGNTTAKRIEWLIDEFDELSKE